MSTNIYVLKLEGGRYYVGKSDNPTKRYQEHLNGSGSSWTKKYKPIGVEKIIQKASPFDEDRYVKEYMAKYGMDKVRGGAYVGLQLDKTQEYTLNKELRAAQDCCNTCGRKGHWAKDCYARTELVQSSAPEKKGKNDFRKTRYQSESEEDDDYEDDSEDGYEEEDNEDEDSGYDSGSNY